MPDPEATFFRTPADWRAWLEAHAAEATHLWVGFHKRGSHEGRGAWPRSSTTRPRDAGCVTSSGQAAAHDREHEVFRS